VTVLAVIPARGGSKGVPRKNVRPLAGHPLIAWTIDAARRSGLLDRVVVSTEDGEIAAAAGRYGAEVLGRPAALAGDEATSRDVLAHAYEALGRSASTVVLLQATSPVRRQGLVDRTLAAFNAGDWDSMSTGGLQLQYPPHGTEHRRQDIRSVFVNDGSVIVLKPANLALRSLFGPRAGTLVTTREENVDIDDPFDFWMAERIVERALAEGWMRPPEPAR
jgi:N-acylneuraminate cytidylyltransferase